jgi:hypothetical protein
MLTKTGTALEDFYEYELIKDQTKEKLGKTWTVFRCALASIQILMLCTCAAVMGEGGGRREAG